LAPNGISDKYKEDFLAHVCDAIDPVQLEKKQEGIAYFIQRLNTLEEKAQADGLSGELLFEILSYAPEVDEDLNLVDTK